MTSSLNKYTADFRMEISLCPPQLLLLNPEFWYLSLGFVSLLWVLSLWIHVLCVYVPQKFLYQCDMSLRVFADVTNQD